MPRAAAEIHIADAAFRLLAKEPWSGITLASVARAAKLSWAQMLDIAPSRTALVGVMLRRAIADTAKRYQPDTTTQSPRERVFDAILSWFEAQNARKKAIRALYADLRREPLTLVSLRGDFADAAGSLLALAENDAGAASSVRAMYICGVIGRALPVWLADDDNMGRSMAQIDRDLRRVERFLWPAEKPKQKPRPQKTVA